MTGSGNRLVLADSPGPQRDNLVRLAREAGFAVDAADDTASLLALLDAGPVDLLMIDLALAVPAGMALLRRIGQRRDGLRVVLTGRGDDVLFGRAERFARQSGIAVAGVLAAPVTAPDLAGLFRLVGPVEREVRRADLAHAIAAGEIEAHYQPKFAATPQGLRLMGAEALARWRHPRLGLLVPWLFFDDLEGGGLEEALTDRMLDDVVRHAAAWRSRGHDLQFAVNVPAGLIANPAWPERVDRCLLAHGLPAANLALEITEGGMMHQATSAHGVLTQLRERGISLALDDFGTGYSSLMRLHLFPFSEIKIDRAFVAEMLERNSAGIIVAATIEMAHRLGLTVCAEGVENEALADALRAMGCDLLQGHHLGGPIAAEAFGDYLERRDGER